MMIDPGSVAPDFILPDQNGNEHNLSDYKGKWVVLYFYPKDLTPGCTTEACNFRDDFRNFKKLDAAVLGISKDSVKRHQKFAEKYELPFVLLSDEQGFVCENYGAWQEKSMYGKKYMGISRSTYLIDPAGKVAKVYPKVNPKNHAEEILKDLNEFK
jgi:peroxiredoxin Q/BCP